MRKLLVMIAAAITAMSLLAACSTGGPGSGEKRPPGAAVVVTPCRSDDAAPRAAPTPASPAAAANMSFRQRRKLELEARTEQRAIVMVVTNSLPVKNVAEFVEYCKANPGKVNMASSGNGTSTHLSGELFKAMTGCNMLHVPYKGAGPALIDLTAGQVQVFFDNLPSSVVHIKGGRIRALGVTSEGIEPSAPELPTVGATVKGYEATAWFGIGMPKNTPTDVIAKMNAEVNKALADPVMQKRLAELGGVSIAGTPADFGKVIVAETEKWAKVVQISGAKVE